MDELQMLRDLPAVANVSKDRITYSNAFKQVCVIRYLAGESPTKIFREAGLPPELSKEKLDDIAGIANPDKANIGNAPHPLDGANVSGGGIYPLTCPSRPMRLPSPCRLHLSARAAALAARRRLSSSNNRLGASTSWNAKTNRSVAS